MKLDATLALARALIDRVAAPHRLELAATRSTTWSSATFVGARHRLDFRLSGPDVAVHAAALAGALEIAEFDMPGHLVADIAITTLTIEAGEAGEAALTIEALTVEAD